MKKLPNVKNYINKSLLSLNTGIGIFKAIDFLIENMISGAPVVNNNGKLVGFISEKDCFMLLAKGEKHKPPLNITVADIMSKKVRTVTSNTDIYTIANLFYKRSYRILPVVDNKKLVGCVSRRDILRAIQENSEFKNNKTDIAPKAKLIKKEDINKRKFPNKEVLISDEAKIMRNNTLKMATRLGNIHHNKVTIIFEDEKELLKVNTTIWATTEKNITLKGGILIPIKRIREVRML